MNRKLFLFLICSISFSLAFAQKAGTTLFDGKTLNGWKRLAGEAAFSIEDGMIVGTSVLNTGNTFLATEKEYGDFVLELDVKIEGGDNNAGIQTRSHYNASGNGGKGQVYGRQIEIDPSARKWSGGIYDEARRKWLYPLYLNPTAQEAFKPSDFNHIVIECIGNETKTWVNGVPTAYVIDTFDRSGFIALQVHSISKPEQAGRKVYYKNIRLKTTGLQSTPFPSYLPVVNLVPNFLSAHEKQNNWKLLFDGKSSNGWVGAYKNSFPQKGWEIKNGELQVLPSEGGESTNGGDIVTTDQFSAFDLSFEFRLTPGANSGVKYFVTLSENNTGSAIGLEYQLLDDTLHPDAKMGREGNRTLSSLYDLIKANKTSALLPIGDWNRGRIVVHPDNKVEHYLNGIKVLEYQRGSQAFRDLVAISKYNVWQNFGEAPKGHILLQDHGNAVSFRSIKIRELK